MKFRNRVEARYRGKSKWYKGKVTVNSDVVAIANASQNQSMMIPKVKTALKPGIVENQSGTKAR